MATSHCSVNRCFVLLLVLAAGASAANRYWVGGSGNWSDAAHWSATSGGTGGLSVPTTVDTVLVNSLAGSGTIAVDQAASVYSYLQWDGTGMSLNMNGYKFRCAASWTMYSNSAAGGAGDTLHCAGFTDNNGSFNFQTKTIEVTGTGGVRCNANTRFYDVVWNATGGAWFYVDVATGRINIGRNFVIKAGTPTIGNSDADTLSITGDLIITGGNLTVTSNQILVGRNCAIADPGTMFTRGTSTISLTGTGTLDASQAYSGVWNLNVAANGQTTTFAGSGPPRVHGTLTLGAGTLDMAGFLIYLHGSGTVLVNGGATVANGGTFLYETGSATNITGMDYGSANVWMWGGPVVFTLTSNLTTTGEVRVWGRNTNTSTLNTANCNITAGSLVLTGGTDGGVLNCGSSAITTGTFNQSGSLTNLNLQTSALNVRGAFTVSGGTISRGTSLVNFNGTSGTSDITTMGQQLNNVTFSGSGAKYRLVDSLQCAALTISGDTLNTSAGTPRSIRCSSLNITGGNLTANSSTITVNGNCSIASAAGLFTCGTSTVVLAATGNLSSPANFANRFNNLTQAGGIITTLTGNVMVYGTLTCGAGSTIRADGTNRELRIADYVPVVNTVTWGGGVGKLFLDFWGNAACAGDDYGDCDLRFTNWGGTPAFTGNVTTTGDVSTGTDGSDGRQASIALNGRSLTCRNLTLGEGSSTNRGGRMNLINSAATLTVSGNLTINADNGTYANALVVPASGTNGIFVGGNWFIGSGGAFDAQGSTVTFTGATTPKTVTSNGSAFGKLNVNCAGASVQLVDSLTAADSVTITAGTLNLSGRNLRTAGVLSVPSGTSSTFAGLAGSTISAGSARLNGQSGSLLNLNPAGTWYINAATALAADYATVMNSNASGGVTGQATASCTNGGSNVNWNFGGLAAPGPLSYTLSPATYTVGTAIATNACTNSGGAASSFSISPALSAGLSFNTANGNVTGTPTAAAALQVYKVKATNATGSDSVNLTITVNAALAKPGPLSYTLNPATYTVNTAIATNTCTNGGGASSSFTISPALSAGLSFNTANGNVTGTPTAAAALQVYKVKATNATGSDSVNLTITVNAALAKPGPLSYTLNPATYTVGAAIATNTCTNAGGASSSFSISPAVSAGLSFNTANGSIGGTPTASAALQVYKVKATNATGSDSVNLTITVNMQPPVLSFVEDTLVCTVGVAIPRDSLVSSGGAVAGSFSVNPSVTTQTGLSFSTTTGAVFGTPTTASAFAAYVVSASNAGGTGQATVYIRVKRAAPGTLAYVTSPLVCTSGVALQVDSLRVTGGGAIDSFTVSPALPAGVGLNPANGAVSGTPTDTSKAAAAHAVTAWNESGTRSVVLSAQVKRARPGPLSYASTRPTYTRGSAITPNVLTNLGGRVDAYTITPALPAGLSLDGASGTISGTPTVALAQTVFTVRGTNESGTDSACDTITVSLNVIPPAISYSPSSVTDTVGSAALHAMGNSGSQADSVTISPDSSVLAAVGLHFDRLSGLISGTPSDTLTATAFTVVARNEAGSDTTTLTLGVTAQPAAANPITLQAQALGYSQIELSWNYVGAGGADSVRISYDTLPISVGLLQVNTPWSRHYGVSRTVDTISGLDEQTLYYFAAQARIAGQWTPVSAAASDSATTPRLDPSVVVPNSVVIRSITFDSTLNRLVVSWHYDFQSALAVQYGFVFGTDSAATAALVPGTWRPASDSTMVTYIALGEDIVFDANYYVFFLLKQTDSSAAYASPVADSAIGRVRSGAISWEPFSFFKTTLSDTSWAFNRKVAFWYEGPWNLGPDNYDTLDAFRPLPPPYGFVPVSVGFRTRQSMELQPITMALRYDSIPSGCRAEDIRFYRYTMDGRWMVVSGQSLAGSPGMVSIHSQFLLGEAMILMVDTLPPVDSVLSDLTRVLSAGSLARDTVQLSDNCANMTVTLLFGRAEQAPSRGRDSVLAVTSMVYTTSVLGAWVTATGVRAYLLVSDGRFVDTVNISRQVRQPAASDITAEPTWTPLRTTTLLDNDSLAPVLGAVLGSRTYDPYRCRVFRWYEPDALPADTSRWTEYTAAADSLFRLLPGRLMWIKVKTAKLLDFGAGMSVSLRDSMPISLAANEWTDVATPYRFSVFVGDIKAASAAPAFDSLQVYRWEASAGRYTTQPHYIADLPEPTMHRARAPLNAGARDGYSIYNPTGSAITITIPPVCSAMSVQPMAKQAWGPRADRWAIRLMARAGDGSNLTTVVCGYRKAAGPVSYYPVPPSFGSQSVRLRDSGKGSLHAHAVAHQPDQWGGYAYELVFSNADEQQSIISCSLQGLESLDGSLEVVLVDPADGTRVSAAQAFSVSVPARGQVTRVLAVGKAGYYRHVVVGVKPFAQLAAFPNPFRSVLNVQFLMPAGVQSVEARLYSMDGRLVWDHAVRPLVGQLTRVAWNSREGRTPLAAGNYILRLRALDGQGRSLKSANLRLVNLP